MEGVQMATESITNPQNKNIGGPKAPKDPTKRRSGLYVMLDSTVEATACDNGKASQEIYLVGERLLDLVKFIGGINDNEILELLNTCDGFRKLVHSIGVTVRPEGAYSGTVEFEMQNFGKVDKYGSGTRLKFQCPTDGTELLIKLEDYQWSEDDEVLGKFAFLFDSIGALAIASVVFYLNDGYEVPEVVVETPVDFSTKEYREMIANSLMSKGNNKRIKAAIEKAERGEDITIAYIGGSITQGAGSKPINTGSYAYKSYLKIKEMFGKDGGENIHFIKAGVGGTPSELGMIRYERDILRDGTVKPDIVIVEFAVNDADDETKGNCYESLCLKILSAENKPAVILLFSVFINDWNLQDRLSPIGRHYNLPMVSVKDAVVEQFKLTKKKGNIISKRQYFYDIYHPTNDGHIVMADCISNLFYEIKNSAVDTEDITIDKQPVIGDSFTQIHLIDKKDNVEVASISEGGFTEMDKELQMVEIDDNPFASPQFPNNWMHSAASGNESFKLKIKSKSLVMIFKDSGSNEFGKADVYVDGKLLSTLDPHINNWIHCNPVILYNEQEPKEHQVEIKMSSGDEDKCFTILGFGYTV